jgi:hypothetical protein
MEDAIPSGGTNVPPGASGAERSAAPGAASPLERLASFRFTYLAFCAFVLLNLNTVRAIEALLQIHFDRVVATAVAKGSREADPASGIDARIGAALRASRWIRWGGVRVVPLVVAADGRTAIHAPGLDAPPGEASPWAAYREALLPARIVRVLVSVPHNALVANAVLILYATLLLTFLYLYTRLLTRRELEQVRLVTSTRDALAERAALIERELGAVRTRLAEVEPGKESDAAEIRALRGERGALHDRLAELERREATLRADSAQSEALRAEHTALEDLLEEALADIGRKDEELRTLQKQAKQRAPARREDEQLERRLRALYKNLEIDDRAIADLVGLRDETLKLRAEEMMKRLSDDADHTAVRRKVGGLPPHLSIFELGFAGGGRIYYTKGRVRRHRVLSLGDKASQKRDLEYLSRLPKE